VTVLPVTINLDFVHIDLGNNKVSHEYGQLDCSSLGQYTVAATFEPQADWSSSTDGNPASELTDGKGGWHIFQIIADIRDVIFVDHMVASSWIYVKLMETNVM
jgi:hypothetical protein